MNYAAGARSYERASLNRARRARAGLRRPSLKRGIAISAGLHVLALAALLITIPHSLPPAPPEEEAFTVQFPGDSAHAQKSDRTGKVAAPTEAEMEATDNPAIKPPTKAPIETAPPPPPPPPPPPEQVEPVKVPDIKIEEPPKPSIAPLKAKPPPPPPKAVVKPPPKPVVPPVKSMTSQINVPKKPVPDTHALDNTLEAFMADQKQKAPPTHVYNPERGGKKNAGGSKTGNLTGELSNGQRKQIGDEVRRCYNEDTAAQNYDKFQAYITVTIDAAGVVRDAVLAPQDQARAASDPQFRALAERAVNAVLDPVCAKLPVPPELLGKPSQQLTFRFRP
jgi:outer membrane biosynthesis protein TonB